MMVSTRLWLGEAVSTQCNRDLIVWLVAIEVTYAQ